MDGFLIIDKEKGYTSFDVCNKIRHMFDTKHVGHTGTLDPNATGVLVVALGKACKTLSLINEHDKEYICTIEFGKSYDTIDPTGKLISSSDKQITVDKINEKLVELKKIETQVPPIFSALKVNGKRLYQYAREGKDVEIKSREAHIYDCSICSSLIKKDETYFIDIKLKVSKGFYVRSFVRDLANMLSVDANMYDLRRTKSGDFSIDDSVLLKDVKEANIIKIENVFSNLLKYEIKDYLYKMVLNGIRLDERQLKTHLPFIVTYKNENIAIYKPVNEKDYIYNLVLLLKD